MYEARQQAYIELVQILLDGGIGNENEILEAHSELVDAGLILVLRERAQSFQQENHYNSALTAEWLMGIAEQLVQRLDLKTGNELHFFVDVVKLIAEKYIDEENDDPEEIYPLLQDNLLLLNEELIKTIYIKKEIEVSGYNDISLEVLALGVVKITCEIFADIISEFPLGIKSINLELSIASYYFALSCHSALICYPSLDDFADLDVFNQENLSIQWAAIQYNLAGIYCKRLQGEKQDNIEIAITHYQSALTIFTCELHPENWAMSKCRLGDIYSNRLLGDKNNNLKISQEYYQAALEVYTVDKYPEEWAEVQLDLARLNINGFHDYKAAIDLLQNTYEHLLMHKYSIELIAEVMFELARCLHHIGQLEQAKLLLKDTIRLYQRLEQPTKIAAVTGALGNLELQMGKLTNARVHLQQALDFYHSAGDQKQVVAIQNLQEYLSDPVAQGAS